jgi:tRNA(fMet)-specific endonuclease VapC
MANMDDVSLCLDTSVLIAYLKGRESGASAVEQAIKNRACYVTAITVYELLFGVARIKRKIGEDVLLEAMTVLPFDDGAARRAATLHADLISRNDDIGIKDVLIAAICLEHSLPVLTLNERHFSRVPQLQVLTPDAFLAQLPKRNS